MIQCTFAEIAAVVGCSIDTIELRYSALIKEYREKGKSSLRRWQWKAAERGNQAMLVWLGKQHLDQRDIKEYMPVNVEKDVNNIEADVIEVKALLDERTKTS
jgi:hypothetical protein